MIGLFGRSEQWASWVELAMLGCRVQGRNEDPALPAINLNCASTVMKKTDSESVLVRLGRKVDAVRPAMGQQCVATFHQCSGVDISATRGTPRRYPAQEA